MIKKSEPIFTIPAEDLPDGWSLASIADLVGPNGVFVDGDWVESKDQDPNGDVRLIQLADVGDGCYRDKSSRFLTNQSAVALNCTFLERGDILIARMPDPLGRACIFPGDTKNAVTVVDVAVVRSGPESFNHRWLMNFVNAPAFRSAVASLQSGSTRKRISRKNLAKILLPVPPRKQQDGIVAEIEKQFSRLDEAVANLKRVKVNLKRYKAAVLKAAVEGKLTEEWRKAHPDFEPASKLLDRILAERRAKWEEAELAKMEAKGKAPKNDKWKAKYKEPTAPDTADLPELPAGWIWTTLGSVLLGIEAGKSFKCEERPPREEEVGVVKVSAVTWGEFDEAESKTCLDGSPISENLFVRKGDFLFSRANTIELVGACVIAKEVNRNVMLSDKILRFELLGGFDEWVLYVLRSMHGRAEIERLATGNQESMRNIGQERIRAIRIPLPSITERDFAVTEVDRHLSLSRETETQVDADLKRAERLRQSILRKAFSGELSVQDNPKAPADVLNVPGVSADRPCCEVAP